MRYLQQDKQPPILLQILHAKVDLRLADALNACSKVEAVERLRHESDVDDGDCDVVKSEMSFSNFGHSSTSTTMATTTTTTVNHLLKTLRSCRFESQFKGSFGQLCLCKAFAFTIMKLNFESHSLGSYSLATSHAHLPSHLKLSNRRSCEFSWCGWQSSH